MIYALIYIAIILICYLYTDKYLQKLLKENPHYFEAPKEIVIVSQIILCIIWPVVLGMFLYDLFTGRLS